MDRIQARGKGEWKNLQKSACVKIGNAYYPGLSGTDPERDAGVAQG